MKQVDLKNRLYIIVLKVIMAISIITIIGNLVIHLPVTVNIKWVLLFCAALLNFLYNKYKGLSYVMKFFTFLILTGIVMPIFFIDSGGSKSDTIAYTFFTLILIIYIFDGYFRNILVATLIAAFIGMHIYEYYFPEQIPIYNVDCRFIDRLIQVPILLFLNFLVVRRFADAYDQANKKLAQYAHQDELTGLLNRRKLNDILQNKIDSNEQNGYLIMLDVDNFKLINDKKGHLIGDEVLKYLGNLLNRYFDNGENMISRWGGDEFILVYFGDIEHLDILIEKVKMDFKNYMDPIEPLVDISFGIARIEECQTLNDILAKSDQIMYEKKKLKKQ